MAWRIILGKGLQWHQTISFTHQLTVNLRLTIRSAVGAMLYIMICTRPDISYAVGMLSRFNQKASYKHWAAAKHLMRYLKQTKHYKLQIGGKQDKNIEAPTLTGYCDSNWANNSKDMKSTSGFCFKLNGTLINWSSKKQNCVCTSSTQAELVALTSASKEAMWFRRLLNSVRVRQANPTIIHEDNQSTINNAVVADRVTPRNKHFHVSHLYIQDMVKQGELKINKLDTKEMLADIFTKPLGPTLFHRFRKQLKVGSIEELRRFDAVESSTAKGGR